MFARLLAAFLGPSPRHPGPDQRDARRAWVEALDCAAAARRQHRYAAARAYLGVARRSHLFLAGTVNVLP